MSDSRWGSWWLSKDVDSSRTLPLSTHLNQAAASNSGELSEIVTARRFLIEHRTLLVAKGHLVIQTDGEYGNAAEKAARTLAAWAGVEVKQADHPLSQKGAAWIPFSNTEKGRELQLWLQQNGAFFLGQDGPATRELEDGHKESLPPNHNYSIHTPKFRSLHALEKAGTILHHGNMVCISRDNFAGNEKAAQEVAAFLKEYKTNNPGMEISGDEPHPLIGNKNAIFVRFDPNDRQIQAVLNGIERAYAYDERSNSYQNNKGRTVEDKVLESLKYGDRITHGHQGMYNTATLDLAGFDAVERHVLGAYLDRNRQSLNIDPKQVISTATGTLTLKGAEMAKHVMSGFGDDTLTPFSRRSALSEVPKPGAPRI